MMYYRRAPITTSKLNTFFLYSRPSPLFKVEAVREYRTNGLSFEVVTGARR